MCYVPFSFVVAAVFLRSHKSLESVDPQFTMRRKMEQLREELELMEQLRDVRQANVLVSDALHGTTGFCLLFCFLSSAFYQLSEISLNENCKDVRIYVI